MKPKLGQTVYVVDCFGIIAFKETVGYLGKRSFVVEDYTAYKREWQERSYACEGESWFASLEDLKKAYPNARYDRSARCYVLGETE